MITSLGYTLVTSDNMVTVTVTNYMMYRRTKNFLKEMILYNV